VSTTNRKHGTRSRYVAGCHCAECREANRVYRAEHDRLKLYGRYDDLTDAAPVRAHVEALSLAGIGRRRLAELAGVSVSTVSGIRSGKRGKPVRRVRKDTAALILAVTSETHSVAAHALVDARGTHRRMQALMARGWTQRALVEQMGLSSDNLATRFAQSTVLRSTADAVEALYDRLWDQTPFVDSPAKAAGSRRAMNRARRAGWTPPLAWDDIDTDDAPPLAERSDAIDEMAVELAMIGEPVRLSSLERREAVTRLHSLRLSDIAIAARLHVADRTVLRIRQELGLPAAVGADGEPVAA